MQYWVECKVYVKVEARDEDEACDKVTPKMIEDADWYTVGVEKAE
jgi:hypothetical protein